MSLCFVKTLLFPDVKLGIQLTNSLVQIDERKGEKNQNAMQLGHVDINKKMNKSLCNFYLCSTDKQVVSFDLEDHC